MAQLRVSVRELCEGGRAMNHETSLLSCRTPDPLPASDLAQLCRVLNLSPADVAEWLDVDVSGIRQCPHCNTVYAGTGDHCGRRTCQSSEYWNGRAEYARQYARRLYRWQCEHGARRVQAKKLTRYARMVRSKAF